MRSCDKKNLLYLLFAILRSGLGGWNHVTVSAFQVTERRVSRLCRSEKGKDRIRHVPQLCNSRNLFNANKKSYLFPVSLVELRRANRPECVLWSALESADDADVKGSSSKEFSKRVLASRILLAACLFLFGYRLGLKRPYSSVLTSASSPRRVFALSTVLAVLVARDVWRSIPAWAKPSLVRRAIADTRLLFGLPARISRGIAAKTHKQNDMSDMSTLGGKFQAVWAVVQRRLPSDSLKNINLQSSLVTLLQVFEDQKQQVSPLESSLTAREQRFHSCRLPTENLKVKGLDEWMGLADAAYDELPGDETLDSYLKERNYRLLKHDKTALPGYLGHYVAIHESKKEAVIGIKGTSGLEDMITDMCGAAISYNLRTNATIDVETNSTGPTIRAHEGILLSSVRLADDLQPLMERLLLPQGFKITIVGHSLGAASASLVSVLLRDRLPQLQTDTSKKLRVFAFASPPVLDLTTAESCKSFVTTVVNNGDVITRCNAGPVLVTIEILKIIHGRLQNLVAAADPPLQKATDDANQPVSLTKTLMLLQRLDKKAEEEAALRNSTKGPLEIVSPREFDIAIDKAIEIVGDDDDDQLYVAGKVILLYKDGTLTSEASDSDEFACNKAIPVDSTAPVLRYLELDGRMLEDHMAPSYKASLEKICREQ